MFDLGPATTELARIVVGVRDSQLDAPTPCSDSRVRDLIDHLDAFAQGFTAAAAKTRQPGDRPPPADGSKIGTDWRTRLPARLDELAVAWRDPASWEGASVAGPFEMPAPAVARVAIDELIVHGWDIAAATGQSIDCDDSLVAAALEFVRPAIEQSPTGIPGLFGPPVPVPDGATALDQLLGLTGRDPNWTPADV